ncbi:hypothetical protein FSP39_008169 [Pinctada imbricata]|uniref:Reverse transcriptase domain-containing protein n=1 Tax=Pinctada imbricata TaxID=66713 RepID=A0AA89BT17_PINIB|nr:hypothetical protein FSP39_008169 [Pinctada imbricata]
MSLIDYLLVQKNKLSNIVKFASGDFNTFSDHSPLSFSISISISQEKNTENNTEQKNVRACSTSVKWIEENASAINDVINENVDNLFDCIDSRCDTLDDINHCIHKFSTTLSDLVLPHCKVYHGTMNTGDKVNKPIKQHRPWFTDECKTRYSDYKLALCNFNKCKSSENRRILNEKKLLYKKFIRKKKRQYERHEGNMLSKLRKDNPKVFYKHFAKKKNNANSNISIDDFHEYFKKLVCSEVNENNDNDYSSMDGNDSIYEQLDVQISEKEIINAIAKLKRDKSCAEDGLINEIFINSKITLVPVLCKLFNLIFDTGIFPEAWSSGCIVPIYKKGNVNEPTNYRGITIISCLGKLFTSVLCNRILDWDREYNLITDAQFGFKPGHSTVDAIFVLQSLINRTLKKKGRLYCCFVDYKKAFDYVNRSSLWDKLIKLGIRGKMLGIIRSLYENIKSCVKHNGHLSEYFTTTSGLLQGEVMSPILYSMYVNDFEMHYIEENCPDIEIQMINLFILMYADDTVIMAQNPSELQLMLNSLWNYAQKWDLTVNAGKTKIVIFRNGGKIRANENWLYNGENLEIVDEINYLGMIYLQKRMKWRKCWLLRPFIQLFMFLLAYYTCVSRISDYMHHWSDVLGGSVLGITVSFLTIYFTTDIMSDIACCQSIGVSTADTELPLYKSTRQNEDRLSVKTSSDSTLSNGSTGEVRRTV